MTKPVLWLFLLTHDYIRYTSVVVRFPLFCPFSDFLPADSCRLLRPSGTSSMRGGHLAPLPEELAAVRLTEKFIVFGKANYVGVDA